MQLGTVQNSKNRTVTGQTNHCPVRAAKTHQDYWKGKLKRRTYLSRDGARVEIPEWQVRMFHRGREAWFNLDTPNQTTAAIKARDIYVSLVSAGWDATLEKYKPAPIVREKVCTVGEFLAEVAKRSALKPKTLRLYAGKLRKIVADLAKVEAGMKQKDRRRKYDYAHGGNAAWRTKVDGKPLSILTPDTVNAWRNAYVAKADTDPVARKSAERSAASNIRSARALFTEDVVRLLKLNLPPNPFLGVKLKDPGPQRYHSDINPEWLFACATRELRTDRPQVFLALFLCLWAGLRRKEADLLTWEQVDFAEGRIHIRRTAHFEPKTEESQRMIDLAPSAMNLLREFRQGSDGAFVLAGEDPRPDSTYDYYRCDNTWRFLVDWLREKGVRHQKAIHMLRKESGSLIAANYGIEAARQHLGHRDIRTTSAHYVEKRKRVEITLPTDGGQLASIAG